MQQQTKALITQCGNSREATVMRAVRSLAHAYVTTVTDKLLVSARKEVEPDKRSALMAAVYEIKRIVEIT